MYSARRGKEVAMNSFRLGFVIFALAGLMGVSGASAAIPAELFAAAEAKHNAGDYRGSLAAQPKSADALYWRARAHAGLQSPDRALADLEAALRLNAKDPRYHVVKAQVLYSTRRYADSRRAADAALALDAKRESALLSRGLAQIELGDHTGAEATFRQAAALHHWSALPYSNLGYLKRRTGDQRGAFAAYDQALALNPKNARATRGREELKTAPPEIEQEQKSWSFGDLTSLSRGNDTDPLVVSFSFESMPYRSDAERTRALRSYTETVRKAHPRGFQETSELVAGRPARRFRFVDDDGANSFHYAIEGGAAYYFVQVFAQGPTDVPPPRAQELLASLTLRSPIPVAAGAAPVSPAAAAAATATLPVVVFHATDPCAAAQAAPARGMPWSPAAATPAKLQASSRESTKEIRNMLLPLLRQRAAKAAPGSPQAAQVQADLVYWEGMLRHLGEIGTETTDPMRILELDRLIRIETGGKGTMEVVHDLTRAFRRT